MDQYPISARSLEKHYHIDGDQLERQYKDHLSGYREWETQEGVHAERYLIFPENIGPRLSIDETSLSDGELYTIVTNKAPAGGGSTHIAHHRHELQPLPSQCGEGHQGSARSDIRRCESR